MTYPIILEQIPLYVVKPYIPHCITRKIRSTCLEKLAYIAALHLHINSRRICCKPYEAETYFSLRVLRSTWKAAAIAGCGKSDEMEMEKKKTRIYLPRRA